MWQQRKIVVKRICVVLVRLSSGNLFFTPISCVVFKLVIFSFCHFSLVLKFREISFFLKKKQKQHKAAIYGPVAKTNNCSSCLEYSTVFSIFLLKTVVNHRINHLQLKSLKVLIKCFFSVAWEHFVSLAVFPQLVRWKVFESVSKLTLARPVVS